MTGTVPSVRFIIEIFSSVLGPKEAVYCSAPLTSGKRHVEWLSAEGHEYADIDSVAEAQRESHRETVIERNRAHARAIVERLRQYQQAPIIDPTAFPDLPHWRQTDWLKLWEQVIVRFAHSVVFVDGWNHSNGCAHEFLVAQRNGLPTRDENGKVISLETGITLIERAIAERPDKASALKLTGTLGELMALLRKAV